MARSVSGRTAYVPGNGNLPPMALAPFEPSGMAGKTTAAQPGRRAMAAANRLCNVRFDNRRSTREGRPVLLHDSARDENHSPISIQREYLVGVHLGESIDPDRRSRRRARRLNTSQRHKHHENPARSPCTDGHLHSSVCLRASRRRLAGLVVSAFEPRRQGRYPDTP